MVAVKHTFGLQENGRGAAETIFLESKSVFYSYHPIYGRKLDYGNNIHPCFHICVLMADICGRNLQLWWSWPWCSSVFRAVEVIREKRGQLGFNMHASFLHKFPGGESGKVFNFICLLAFSELCMYCPPNLPEFLCSGWSNFGSAWWELLTGWEVLAIKNRMREVQSIKASARATKASAVVGLAGDQSNFSEVITCTFIS